jgi:hypothetical protein
MSFDEWHFQCSRGEVMSTMKHGQASAALQDYLYFLDIAQAKFQQPLEAKSAARSKSNQSCETGMFK